MLGIPCPVKACPAGIIRPLGALTISNGLDSQWPAIKHLATSQIHSLILEYQLCIHGHKRAEIVLDFVPESALPEILGCLLPDPLSA